MTRAKTPEPPKRMTASRMLEALLARGSGDRSSVTIACNAKGDTQFEVVVRTGDASDIPNVIAAEKRAVEIFERLRKKYPRAEPKPDEPYAKVAAIQQTQIRKLSAERRRLKAERK